LAFAPAPGRIWAGAGHGRDQGRQLRAKKVA